MVIKYQSAVKLDVFDVTSTDLTSTFSDDYH